jgi:predicted O-linked N-acetylglucosamine transferase (SPINDLY family)
MQCLREINQLNSFKFMKVIDKELKHSISGVVNVDMRSLIETCESLQLNGKAEEAALLYSQWLADENQALNPVVQFNYGALLQSLGHLNGAMAAYQNCLNLQPGFAQALINLGLACEKAGQEKEALQHWGQLVNQHLLQVDHDPDMVVMALNHIGRVQENQKRYQLAENALTQSLQLKPDQPHVIQHWVHIRQKACRWPVYQPLAKVNTHDMLMATSPLAMLALHDDPAMQLLCAQSFVRRSFALQTENMSEDRRYGHTRTRIGYVSGDLCVHAVGLLLPEFIEAHDRDGFEIYAYDFSPEDGTAHRLRLKQSFDHFQSVHALSDRQVAELIFQDEIDVLIDLHGLSSGARPGIFALRPAPLQGTYLGFMGTTGMPWFDFVVADREVLPDTLRPFYSERQVLHVDGSFIPLAPRQNLAGDASRGALGLPREAFVMASFGNTYKLNQTLFDNWLGLLRDIPQAVLWLMDDNPDTTRHLKNHALSKGISIERMVFTPRVSHAQFRAQLSLADVFLDTYPYNCGSTSKDVIDAGVPLVTLQGQSQVSRMGASMLKSLGLHALVAEDWPSYQDIVKRLASAELKVDVRAQAQTHLPLAIPRLVRSLERGLVEFQTHH